MRKKEWYDNSGKMTTLMIILLVLIICVIQANILGQKLDFGATISSMLGIGITYILFLLYFVLLKFKVGKKYFNFMNIIIFIIYLLLCISSFFDIFQGFSQGVLSVIIAVLSFVQIALILYYFSKSFFSEMKLWKKLKLDEFDLKELTNDYMFYIITGLAIAILFINVFRVTTTSEFFDSYGFAYLFRQFLNSSFIVMFTRYIYLHNSFKLNSKDEEENLFFEIEKEKESLPHLNKVKKIIIEDKKYNFYQVIAICVMAIGILSGVVLGTSNTTCLANDIYDFICIEEGFNIGLVLVIWFSSMILALFIYWLGDVVKLLENINSKLKK